VAAAAVLASQTIRPVPGPLQKRSTG